MGRRWSSRRGRRAAVLLSCDRVGVFKACLGLSMLFCSFINISICWFSRSDLLGLCACNQSVSEERCSSKATTKDTGTVVGLTGHVLKAVRYRRLFQTCPSSLLKSGYLLRLVDSAARQRGRRSWHPFIPPFIQKSPHSKVGSIFISSHFVILYFFPHIPLFFTPDISPLSTLSSLPDYLHSFNSLDYSRQPNITHKYSDPSL